MLVLRLKYITNEGGMYLSQKNYVFILKYI